MTNGLALEKTIGKGQVVVVDSSMAVTNTVDWMRATNLVLSRDAYVLIPRSNGAMVRSKNLAIPHPLVVCLNRYVPRPKGKVMAMDAPVSRTMVLIRDNWTCQYCDEYGNTIDHIYPKSRGGKNTWGNLCVACTRCNGLKKDRTPEEADMRNPRISKVFNPHRENRLQDAIYLALEEMVAV